MISSPRPSLLRTLRTRLQVSSSHSWVTHSVADWFSANSPYYGTEKTIRVLRTRALPHQFSGLRHRLFVSPIVFFFSSLEAGRKPESGPE